MTSLLRKINRIRNTSQGSPYIIKDKESYIIIYMNKKNKITLISRVDSKTLISLFNYGIVFSHDGIIQVNQEYINFILNSKLPLDQIKKCISLYKNTIFAFLHHTQHNAKNTKTMITEAYQIETKNPISPKWTRKTLTKKESQCIQKALNNNLLIPRETARPENTHFFTTIVLHNTLQRVSEYIKNNLEIPENIEVHEWINLSPLIQEYLVRKDIQPTTKPELEKLDTEPEEFPRMFNCSYTTNLDGTTYRDEQEANEIAQRINETRTQLQNTYTNTNEPLSMPAHTVMISDLENIARRIQNTMTINDTVRRIRDDSNYFSYANLGRRLHNIEPLTNEPIGQVYYPNINNNNE